MLVSFEGTQVADAMIEAHSAWQRPYASSTPPWWLVMATALGSQWASWHKKLLMPWPRTTGIVHALPLCGIRVTFGPNADTDRLEAAW